MTIFPRPAPAGGPFSLGAWTFGASRVGCAFSRGPRRSNAEPSWPSCKPEEALESPARLASDFHESLGPI